MGKFIVTGAAGFIGYHVSLALLARGDRVVAIDNLSDYYSVALKRARLERLSAQAGFEFHPIDITDREAILALFRANADARGVVHLAAQAGVRYSLENPYVYADTNVKGQVTIFEAARYLKEPTHLVYASSSSVYGANTKLPFSVEDPVERPISLYAATKRGCELIARSYSHLYGLPVTGLRFFTVYGPWGRPDMAAYLFADAIMAGKPIRVFNHGHMKRDFTYVDDIVGGVLAALDRPAQRDGDGVRHRLYNLGNHRSEDLLHFIDIIETALDKKAVKQLEPLQPGDVPETFADIESSRRDLGFEPSTPIDVGLPRFIDWYRRYHAV